MTAVVFDLLEARRMRNPSALTPAQRAAHAVHAEGQRLQAPGDLVRAACELVADFVAREQMQPAINRANCWLRNAVRQRTHYTAPQPPSAA